LLSISYNNNFGDTTNQHIRLNTAHLGVTMSIRDIPLPQTTTAIPPLPHDVCRSNPQCLNGGTCVVFKPGQVKSGINDEYNYCKCENGFGGQRCEAHCPLQCQNGGICHPKSAMYGPVNINDPNPFVCQCLGHFTGTECDIPYENCADGSQCFYGGVCRDKEGDIPINYCECPPTHDGVGCQNEISTVSLSEQNHIRDNSAASLKYISLGIVIAITVFFGVGLVMMRRRRKRNERRYHAIQSSDHFHNGIETSELNRKQQEQWRNVV
jgi:hypothetical protein